MTQKSVDKILVHFFSQSKESLDIGKHWFSVRI